MKLAVGVAACLLTAGSVSAQQKDDCCTKGKGKTWSGYGSGIRWTQPEDSARANAKELDRPLILFRLVGDLDKEGC